MTEIISVILPLNAPVELKVNGFRYWITDPLNENEIEKDLPAYYIKRFGCHYQLNRTLHEWMIENHIIYEICYDIRIWWHLNFQKKSDATLFKLRWC